jgi:hypothetical protein
VNIDENKKIRELLYRSFDDHLTVEEEEKLTEALAKSKELREERDQLSTLRKVVVTGATDSFKPFFVERVMRGISLEKKGTPEREPFFKSLFTVFRPIAVAAVILIIVLVSLNLLNEDNLSLASAFALPEVTVEEAFDPTLILSLE